MSARHAPYIRRVRDLPERRYPLSTIVTAVLGIGAMCVLSSFLTVIGWDALTQGQTEPGVVCLVAAAFAVGMGVAWWPETDHRR